MISYRRIWKYRKCMCINVKEGIKMEVAVKINYTVLCVFMARLREERGSLIP
jgi:hypothetical protein